MNVDQGQIDAIVQNPSESLNIEIKRWLDPSSIEGQAKIVRAVFALRNRDGGYFVVGFDDATLQPDNSNRPPDVRAAFHVDLIQGLISKYASDLFEIGVAFAARAGIEHPVIVVPAGVRTPVAAKRGLAVPGSSKPLIGVGDVYFRTLQSSGIASTSVARPEDWSEIVRICFANREADIGSFLRRQLSGTDPTSLRAALGQLLAFEAAAAPAPSLCEEAATFLNSGNGRFQKALAVRQLAAPNRSMAYGLSMHVALVISPRLPDAAPDAGFLGTVLGSNPRYTGWPVWLDARFSATAENRPVVRDRGWEAMIVSVEGMSRHLDFFRLERSGRFYLRRALQDDLTDKVKPGEALDPILLTIRVAEVIAVGLQIARAVVDAASECRLAFAFRWERLSGRTLKTWANPMLYVIGEQTAADDAVETCVEVPSSTPVSAIAPFVELATRDLFAAFQGATIPTNVYEEWTKRLLERRLSS